MESKHYIFSNQINQSVQFNAGEKRVHYFVYSKYRTKDNLSYSSMRFKSYVTILRQD